MVDPRRFEVGPLMNVCPACRSVLPADRCCRFCGRRALPRIAGPGLVVTAVDHQSGTITLEAAGG